MWINEFIFMTVLIKSLKRHDVDVTSANNLSRETTLVGISRMSFIISEHTPLCFNNWLFIGVAQINLKSSVLPSSGNFCDIFLFLFLLVAY